ncbi:MAG: D-alanine--D-alanine ligase family protein [Nitrospinota bacterium]
MAGDKRRICVIFGGRSAEHEVSLDSGRSVMGALDPGRHEILPLLVSREGRWLLLPAPKASEGEGREVLLPPAPGNPRLLWAEGGGVADRVDAFFPMIHGTFGEDGTLQGLLELADIPFVGSGCTASAVSMDKGMTKAVLRAAGLPVLPTLTVTKGRWEADRGGVLTEARARFTFPVFVKPASLGSSVGVHRVEDEGRLERAITDAMGYDVKVLVEEEAQGREVECSVLEGPSVGELLASPLAEIRPRPGGWYDYQAKYTPGLTEILIPAPLDGSVAERIRAHARTAFLALGCSGLARADFFFRERTGEVYINEVNTLPGFTPLSGYPKMIQAAGISYPAMLDRLIACAFSRAEQSRARSFRRLG